VRRITKQAGDKYLLQWASKEKPTTGKEAGNAWKRFSRHKKHTRNICVREQYQLCCYSEADFNTRKLGFHLEHIQPKGQFPGQTFEHANLAGSAISEESKHTLDNMDIFGGFARDRGTHDDWYHPDAFIHPLRPDCEHFYHYETSGRIVPRANQPRRDRARARLTLYRLNLNAPLLVSARKTILEALENQLAGITDLTMLEQLACHHLLPRDGVLPEFHSARKQRFGKLGLKVLTEQAPADLTPP